MKQLIDESIYCPHKLLPENIFIELPNVVTLEKIIEIKLVNLKADLLYFLDHKMHLGFRRGK